MIIIRQTTDVNWIWQIATRPDIWKAIGGSDVVTKDQIVVVVEEPYNIFLAPEIDDTRIGYIPFLFKEPHVYEMHLCLTEHGIQAIQGCQAAVKWMFAETPAELLLAEFPSKRRDVRLFCGWVGFRVDWRDKDTTRMVFRKVK